MNELLETLLEDVQFVDIMNNIVEEDAGGARGKYIQLQKEKIKKLEEEKSRLRNLMSHATGDRKREYGDKIYEIEKKIREYRKDIDKYGDDSDRDEPRNYDKDTTRIHNTANKDSWRDKVRHESKTPVEPGSALDNINKREEAAKNKK